MSLEFGKTPQKNQYIAVFIVNLISFTHGSISAWLSPALMMTLRSRNTPLKDGPLSTDEISWLSASIFLGGTVGVLLSEPLRMRFGNRFALISLAVPHLIWWSLITFGNQYWHLVFARTVLGYTGGNLFKVIPLYVAEISQSDIRGRLGSMLSIICNTGVLFGFLLGQHVPHNMIPCTAVLSALYILLVFFYIPETPQQLLKHGNTEAAYKSLLHYRTISPSEVVPKYVEIEFSDMKNQQVQKQEINYKSFFNKKANHAMAMSLFLLCLIHVSGTVVLSQFTASIFMESGSNLVPNMAAITVECVKIFGNFCAMFLVDFIGRKMLLLISCFGTAVSLTVLGTYTYLAQAGYESIADYNWIPVVSFSMGIFLLSIGITSITYTIVTEILPFEIKGVGMTIVTAMSTFFGALVLKWFPVLMDEFEIYGVFWFHASSCVIGILVIAIFLPETKGKNLTNE